MNAWEWLDVAFCSRLALTLLHCLWQATIIATVAILTTRLWRGSTAQMRYMVHICALLAMVACLPVTYLLLTTASPDDGELVVVQEPRETIVIVPDLPLESKERSGHEIPLAGSSEALTGSTHVDLPLQQPVREPFSDDVDVPASRAADASTVELVQSSNRDAAAAPESGWLHRARAFAPYAALVYVVGVAAMLLRLFVALWAGQRLRGRAEPVTEAKLLGLVRQQAQRLGLRAAPAIYYCGRVTAPVVIGVLRPIILLPCAIATGLSVDQIQAVLTHELAHVRRLDPLINLFQRMAESLLFFHPAAWYISRQASYEREHCCDDLVLAMGHTRLDYAEMLLRVAEIGSDAGGSTEPHVAALAATGKRPSQLRQRILRLLSGDAEGVRLNQRGTVALTALLFAALLAPLYMFSAQANHAENGQDNTTDSATVESTSDQDVANMAHWPKSLKKPADRGSLSNTYQKVIGGKPSKSQAFLAVRS